jgi:hypothetical protein
MPDQELVRGSLDVSADSGSRDQDAVEDRRRYNREFMRRWRADPFHVAVERAQRRQRYLEVHKQRKIERSASSPQARERDGKLCGFCWKRRAVRKIARLQVCESAPDGYVKVRIPYCGQC